MQHNNKSQIFSYLPGQLPGTFLKDYEFEGIDFETYLITSQEPWPKPVCLSSYVLGQTGQIYIGMDEIRYKLTDLLQSDKIIIAHNVSFEANVIYKHFPELQNALVQSLQDGRWFCTKLYQTLLDNISRQETHKKSLADLVLKYFKEDISETKTDPDAWRLRYSELDGKAVADWPEAAIDYAIGDSIWAVKVFYEQLNIEILDYRRPVYEEFCLNEIGAQGSLVCQERVAELEKECWNLILPSLKLLNDHNLLILKNKYKSNGDVYSSPVEVFKSTKHTIEEISRLQAPYLDNWLENCKLYTIGKRLKKIQEYIGQNFKTRILTPKKVVSTTDSALATYLGERQDEVLEALKTIKEYEKILTAFVSRLKQADPYIRSNYNSLVSSGRTSSHASKAYPSLNIQQLPRGVENVTWDIRNCLIPHEGYEYLSIDYNGLELSATANQLHQLLGRSRMQQTINSGNIPVDMHSKFACRIKSMKDRKLCSYSQFVLHKKEKGYKEFRTLAKPINLGFPGGIGYDTMRELLAREGIYPKFKVLYVSKSEAEVEDLVKQYRKKYPVRLKRLAKWEYALVYDELVELKNELFELYPDLKYFLQEGHKQFLTGKQVSMRNEFGEYELEDMYEFNIKGTRRNWCTYTAFCNGYTMQSPAARGAKRAFVKAWETFRNDDRVNLRAFIHDEIVAEIKQCPEKEQLIEQLSRIMIEEMQKELIHVRIAVEAETMPYWMKAGGDWSKVYWIDHKGTELRSM